MRIPEEKIEEIRAVADIVEVVSEYVALRPRGSNFVGLCPFHSERTPSFNVNPQRAIFKCFGCGKGGDVFSFIREIEHVSYPESVRLLAQRMGIELPEREDEAAASAGEAEALYAALRFAGRFYYEALGIGSSEVSSGWSYFQKRGLGADITRKFGLGYAPPGWDNLLRHAHEGHLNPEHLLRSGLLVARSDESGFYDRFRDRAMFPLFSHTGKVVGFAGRILSEEKDQPKYINTPETEVYHKGEVLYGLFQGRSEIRKRGEALLVEGYTDVLSTFQAGVRNVVATSGTALTRDQLKLLGRYAQSIVLVFDADSAGSGATVRGIDLALEAELAVSVVELPEGADPDSFVRQFDGTAFRRYVEKYRKDFVRFKVDLAERSGALAAPESKLAAIRNVLESIASIRNPILQGEYLQELGSLLRVPDADLRAELAAVLEERKRMRRAEERRAEIRNSLADRREEEESRPERTDSKKVRGGRDRMLPEERILLRLMLDEPGEMVQFVMSRLGIEDFTEGPPRDLAQKLLEMFEAGTVRREPFLDGSCGADLQQLAADVLSDRHDVSANWEQRLGMSVPKLHEFPTEVATSAIRLLKHDRIDQAIRNLQRRIYETDTEGGDLTPLLTEMQHLQELRRSNEKSGQRNAPG